MPLFSIIIPTYNSASCIAQCINSIVEQADQDFEVLLQDGLSNDDTLRIVAAIAKANPAVKIRIISEKDNGIYDAMNKAMRMAAGQWVYFLGADDSLYDPEVLQRMHAVISAADYDVIYGNVYHKDLKRVYDGEFNDEKICREGICHQSIFYKKSVLEAHGGYREDMKAYAHIYLDKILFTDKSLRWKFVDTIIANYDGGGFSSTYFDKVYWNEAEKLLNDRFKNRVSKKVIYESMQPVVNYQFSLHSFLLSWKIAWYARSAYPVKRWFGHPIGIAKLMMRKLVPR